MAHSQQNKEAEDDEQAGGKGRKGDDDDYDNPHGSSGEPRPMTAAEREALREANDRYQRASQAHARLRSGDGDALSALQVTLPSRTSRVLGGENPTMTVQTPLLDLPNFICCFSFLSRVTGVMCL